MRVQYMKGVATHHGPESCVPAREGRRPDLRAWERSVDRGSVGRDIEPRNQASGVPTLLLERKATLDGALSLVLLRAPRGRRPCACVEAPCARTGRSHRHPLESPASRVGKAQAVIP